MQISQTAPLLPVISPHNEVASPIKSSLWSNQTAAWVISHCLFEDGKVNWQVYTVIQKSDCPHDLRVGFILFFFSFYYCHGHQHHSSVAAFCLALISDSSLIYAFFFSLLFLGSMSLIMHVFIRWYAYLSDTRPGPYFLCVYEAYVESGNQCENCANYEVFDEVFDEIRR